MFIHDALSQLIVYGETDILAANIRINTNRMKEYAIGETVTGFQKQFQVIMKCILYYGVCGLLNLSHDDNVYEVPMTTAQVTLL